MPDKLIKFVLVTLFAVNAGASLGRLLTGDTDYPIVETFIAAFMLAALYVNLRD